MLAYATLLTIFAFRQSSEAVTVWVCLPPTAYWGVARRVWVGSNALIVLLVLIIYSLAHSAVRRKGKQQNREFDIFSKRLRVVRMRIYI